MGERWMRIGAFAQAAGVSVDAVRFYERRGFTRVPTPLTAELLRRYWSIPERQIETSVVLADPPLAA